MKSKIHNHHRGEKLRVWQTRSHSSPDKVYDTILWANQELTCNCRGWIFPKNGNPRTCRHVVSAKHDLNSLSGLSLDDLCFSLKTNTHNVNEISHEISPKKYYRMIRVAE